MRDYQPTNMKQSLKMSIKTNLAAIIGIYQNFDYRKLGANINQCYWNKYYLPTYLPT